MSFEGNVEALAEDIARVFNELPVTKLNAHAGFYHHGAVAGPTRLSAVSSDAGVALAYEASYADLDARTASAFQVNPDGVGTAIWSGEFYLTMTGAQWRALPAGDKFLEITVALESPRTAFATFLINLALEVPSSGTVGDTVMHQVYIGSSSFSFDVTLAQSQHVIAWATPSGFSLPSAADLGGFIELAYFTEGNDPRVPDLQTRVEILEQTGGSAGPAGRGITSIVRTAGTGAAGTTDTYTITYSDASTTTFTVVNGANGTNGTPGAPGAPGAPGSAGSAGRGVTSIARTSGTGAAGTVDTYTITYSDSTTSTFQVTNGAPGVLLLSAAAAVPGGTPVGTLIFRKAT